jgi:hypothetical protein
MNTINILRKTFLLATVSLIFWITRGWITPASGQPAYQEKNNFVSEQLVVSNDAGFLDFNVRPYSDKVFLKWIVSAKNDGSLYVVQRSVDGSNFKPIGTKEGVEVNVDVNLLYCFTDTKPVVNKCWYRIGKVSEDGSMTYSHILIAELPGFQKAPENNFAINP